MHTHPVTTAAASLAAALATAATAGAQSLGPAVFVSNDGNTEGSVTSYAIAADGTPSFVQNLRLSENADDPTTNANSIAISPNGRYLAVGHASGGTSPFRPLTLIEVDQNANMSVIGEFNVPATPISLAWVNNQFLALTQSDSSGLTNRVLVYRFTPGPTPAFFQVGDALTGDFTTSIVKSPNRDIIYANNTFGGNAVFTFEVDEDGNLTELAETSTGSIFPLGLAISNNAELLYGFGGISGGGESAVGLAINQTNAIPSPLPNSPYTSPGASPKGGAFSPDDSLLFVTHGTDATVRSFTVDNESGDITSTGNSFDVGLQGSLDSIAVLGDVVYLTDNSNAIDMQSGLIALAYDSEGNFTNLTPAPVDSQGVTPSGIAAWPGVNIPCPGDTNADLIVDLNDLLTVLANFGQPVLGGPTDGDVNDSGTVDLEDLLIVLAEFGNTCQ